MSKKIQARVLADVRIDGVLYRSNSAVIEIDGDIAKPFIKDGSLDDTSAAVKYALGEGGLSLVKHASPVAQEEPAPEINPDAPVD